MHLPLGPSLATLLTVLVMFVTMFMVGRARGKYRIAAPATTGHPDFERLFRIQMNTLEASVLFLPTLWIDVAFGVPSIASWAGLGWVLGRVVYIIGYAQAPSRRSAGFGIAMLAWAILMVDATIGLLRGFGG